MEILLVYYEMECWIISYVFKFITNAFKKLGIKYDLVHGNDILKVYNQNKHKLVIFLHPTSQILPNLEKNLQISSMKIWWDFEAPYEIDTIIKGLPYVDKVFTHCKNSVKFLNSDKVTYVPTASDITIYHPMEVETKYKSDICFVGNCFPSRYKYFEDNYHKFKGKDVLIIGLGYGALRTKYRIIENLLPPEEISKYYNGAGEVLEMQRTVNDADLGQNKNNIIPSFLPIRHWDIIACKDKNINIYNISFEKRVKDFIMPLL